MKTLKRLPIELLEIGDPILRNGKHHEIVYIEKDVHGYDVYANDVMGRRTYFFVADGETVTIDK
jgi:hypothetical protein